MPSHSGFARRSFEIYSPRLVIRTPTAADAEAYHKLLSTPENFPHEEPEGLTLDRVRTRIGRFAEMTTEGKNAFMIFVLRETGELIGHGGYNTFESVDPVAFLSHTPNGDKILPPDKEKKYMTDFGIMVDHRHWRRGYALELLSALVEYAHNELRCELFRTETGTSNDPWRALMRSAGLGAFEGTHRASYDENLEVWVWKFYIGQWAKAKDEMKANRKWYL